MSRREQSWFGTDLSGFPVVDDQSVVVDAPVTAVWNAVGEVLGQADSRGLELGGRLLRLQPATSAGDPLVVGSAIPGFGVVLAEPHSKLRLQGAHRFSSYALTFHFAVEDERTVLRAETRAIFPGRVARLYRTAVVDSRLSKLGTGAMLRAIRRRAKK